VSRLTAFAQGYGGQEAPAKTLKPAQRKHSSRSSESRFRTRSGRIMVASGRPAPRTSTQMPRLPIFCGCAIPLEVIAHHPGVSRVDPKLSQGLHVYAGVGLAEPRSPFDQDCVDRSVSPNRVTLLR
jgi:hypothetical protein